MAEFDFIASLLTKLATQHPANRSLLIPPGDDAALLPPAPQGLLLAADMLMDGVHFELAKTAPERIGHKALAVNLSDMAAMAGTPNSVVLCLALPSDGGTALAQRLIQGMLPLAADFGVAIAGGDTNSWRGPLVISVAVTGTPHPRGSVQRQGAKPGDWLCVTGTLGGSRAAKHLDFSPRVREAHILHRDFGLTAMLDLSDGLGSDLRHILGASAVGAVLDAARLPISADVHAEGDAAVARALSDGEDFELCFTLPAAAGAQLIAAQPFGAALPIHHIGTITSARQLVWSSGAPVVESGWVHALD